jgi:hypothetical protein
LPRSIYSGLISPSLSNILFSTYSVFLMESLFFISPIPFELAVMVLTCVSPDFRELFSSDETALPLGSVPRTFY